MASTPQAHRRHPRRQGDTRTCTCGHRHVCGASLSHSPRLVVAPRPSPQADWGPLYDAKMLRSPKCPPVAALVSYEDIYVERDFSERTSRMLGPEGGGTARLWITNEFQHSGLRDQPAVVFERLLAMAKGDIAIPS